ncbi:MAG: hypothetical protein ISS55_00595 [Dehalococcoidales bacterium]|nr:hypothetical protein [Dehalococcoidales bacterium]
MIGLLGLLRSRVAGWPKGLAKRNGHRPLPEKVQAYLMKEFRLLPTDMENLRYVARTESIGSKDMYIRVFDVTKVRDKGVTVKKYGDLERHSELVLFYGRMGKSGVSYLKREYRTIAGGTRTR